MQSGEVISYIVSTIIDRREWNSKIEAYKLSKLWHKTNSNRYALLLSKSNCPAQIKKIIDLCQRLYGYWMNLKVL